MIIALTIELLFTTIIAIVWANLIDNAHTSDKV
jgi:hypothetical protein